jgi:predicted metal-dependent peptidase
MFIRYTIFPDVEAQRFCEGSGSGVVGTNFKPAIAAAGEWRPDLLIYLTDLEGDAGDEPAFPVLWAVPEGKAEAPWGKIIELG